MEIAYYSEKNKIKRIGLIYLGAEYVYIYDANQKMISLLTGNELLKKYKEYIDSGFEGCIECELTQNITKGISKNLDEIIEFEIKIPEANEIVKKINEKIGKKTGEKFPYF
ncbi:MAG: hypothetical protein ACTSQO_02570 [Candidatus Helarchaeota archaeon]